jgi:hypothetical protein
MHEKTDLGRLIVSHKRNLLKFIYFTKHCRPELPSENCILLFGDRMDRTCFAFRGNIRAGCRFAMDDQAQARRCQDPRGGSSLDRAARALLKALNHGRTATLQLPCCGRAPSDSVRARGLQARRTRIARRAPISAIPQAAFRLQLHALAYISAIHVAAGDVGARATAVTLIGLRRS